MPCLPPRSAESTPISTAPTANRITVEFAPLRDRGEPHGVERLMRVHGLGRGHRPAIDALKPIEAMAQGLSVIIAPERTRPTIAVGRLKGAVPHRLGRSAAIPTFPIVIRNAEVTCGRNSTSTNLGTVDVAGFELIPMETWILNDLKRVSARSAKSP